MALAKQTLASGFEQPVHGSQSCFRAVLDAMARPGRLVPLDLLPDTPDLLPRSMAALALTLVDNDTKLYLAGKLNSQDIRTYLTFHCAAPITDRPEEADFILSDQVDALPPYSHLKQGEIDYPDRSATVILAVSSLDGDGSVELSGPGVDGVQSFGPAELESDFWRQMQANHARYPLGVDTVFCDASHISALPRSTRINITRKD